MVGPNWLPATHFLPPRSTQHCVEAQTPAGILLQFCSRFCVVSPQKPRGFLGIDESAGKGITGAM